MTWRRYTALLVVAFLAGFSATVVALNTVAVRLLGRSTT